ncbi:MAG: hypothetical protein ACRD13_04500, partial [Terriglobales bacterium]
PGLTAEVILRRAARAGDADSQALEDYTWLERDREYSLNAHGRYGRRRCLPHERGQRRRAARVSHFPWGPPARSRQAPR